MKMTFAVFLICALVTTARAGLHLNKPQRRPINVPAMIKAENERRQRIRKQKMDRCITACDENAQEGTIRDSCKGYCVGSQYS